MAEQTLHQWCKQKAEESLMLPFLSETNITIRDRDLIRDKMIILMCEAYAYGSMQGKGAKNEII